MAAIFKTMPINALPESDIFGRVFFFIVFVLVWVDSVGGTICDRTYPMRTYTP